MHIIFYNTPTCFGVVITPSSGSWHCCILRGPGVERILDVVPRATELGTRLRREIGQAAHTLNNPQLECTGVLLCVIREKLQLKLNSIGDKSRQRSLHYR